MLCINGQYIKILPIEKLETKPNSSHLTFNVFEKEGRAKRVEKEQKQHWVWRDAVGSFSNLSFSFILGKDSRVFFIHTWKSQHTVIRGRQTVVVFAGRTSPSEALCVCVCMCVRTHASASSGLGRATSGMPELICCTSNVRGGNIWSHCQALKLGAFGPSSCWTPDDESEQTQAAVMNERVLLATFGMKRGNICRWADNVAQGQLRKGVTRDSGGAQHAVTPTAVEAEWAWHLTPNK